MTHTHKDITQLAARLLKVWKSRLNLSSWLITLDWCDGDFAKDNAGYPAAAFTRVDTSRMRARVFLVGDLGWLAPGQKCPHASHQHLEDTIVHELLHIYTGNAMVTQNNLENILKTHLSPELEIVVRDLFVEMREGYVEAMVELVMGKKSTRE